jgi:nucleotide-binding universal stress UspA family protein
MEQTVLVPVDGSDNAWDALDHALEQYDPQQLRVLYVIDPLEGDYEVDESTEQATKQSEQVETETKRRVRSADADPAQITVVTSEGRPAEEIVAQAETEEIQQIVMGSRGLSGVKRLLLGSVAETVVRRADVPVNVVR